MNKKTERQVILVGLAASAILLIIFAISQNFDLRYLYLPHAWFFVSSIPIMLALFIGGFIRKGSFAGVEFEISNEKAVELVIPATADVVANVPPMIKSTFEDLKKLNVEQRRNIKILKFEKVWADEYKEDIIYAYFDALINLSYIQVNRENQPSQYLSVEALKSFCFPRQYLNTLNQLIEDVIDRPSSTKRFLSALSDDRILNEFGQYASELVVSTEQSLEEVLKEMYNQKVEFAAVFSTNQNFIGIIEARSIEQQIGKSFLKRK